jgi:hypothetical protein
VVGVGLGELRYWYVGVVGLLRGEGVLRLLRSGEENLWLVGLLVGGA